MLKRSLSLLVFAAAVAAVFGIVLAGSPARADIALSDSGTLWTDNSGNQTITNNFTISPAANVLVVELGWRELGPNGPATPTVTYNGAPLTEAVLEPSQSNFQVSAIYYLASSSTGWATGASDPLSVNFGVDASGNTASDGCIDAFTLSGVDLTKLPSASSLYTTAGTETDNNAPTSSLTMTNVPEGAWVAFTTSYRSTTATNPLLHAWTLVAGGIVGGQTTSGNGNQWCAETTANPTIEAGALYSNVESPTFTITESNGVNSYVHWTSAAAVFVPSSVSYYSWTGTAGSGGNANWNTSDANWRSAALPTPTAPR